MARQGGDTAATLIHQTSHSSAKHCSRSEWCWRAHQRTLLYTELQRSRGTAGGTYTRCGLAVKGSVSEKGDGADSTTEHHSPTALILMITRTFYTATIEQACCYLALKTSPGWLIIKLRSVCSATHALIHVHKKNCTARTPCSLSPGAPGDTVTPAEIFLVSLYCMSELSITLSSSRAGEYNKPTWHKIMESRPSGNLG